MKIMQALVLLSLLIVLETAHAGESTFEEFNWQMTNRSAEWAPRAGHQVLNIGSSFFLLAGRTPLAIDVPGASIIWGDVWRSDDFGRTWQMILEDAEASGQWSNRSYFQAVEKDGYMYILGGQNYKLEDNQCPPFPVVPPCPPVVSVSDFFNDVWRSQDGITWEQMTAAAPWEGRAGLSAVALGSDLYVMAGSQNDDSAVIGGPPVRIYFNDVWKSTDNGATWVQMTDNAPWSDRAGGVALEKDGWMYMLGGEAGFVGPYFNDVWRSQDGTNWQQVTAAAGWSPRPGHKCAVLLSEFVCFGGFGLFQNPIDVWVSPDGAAWDLLPGAPWNAQSSEQIKYDFDVVTTEAGEGGVSAAIYSFGGDRERFDLPAEENASRVDNDVWRFSADPVPEAAALPVPINSRWALALLALMLIAHGHFRLWGKNHI